MLCSGPAHLVGLPRSVGCLQGLVQPLGHQHQEASHPIQGLCTVDFRLRDDGLGLGSAVGREQRAQLCLEWPPGDIYSGEKNLHPECKIKHTSDKRKRKRGERKPEKQTCLLRAALKIKLRGPGKPWRGWGHNGQGQMPNPGPTPHFLSTELGGGRGRVGQPEGWVLF